MDARARWFHGPVAASVFAGFLGAGAVDAVVVMVRGTGAPAGQVLALGLALYGAGGLAAGLALGWLVAAALGALPAGPRTLTQDPATDDRVASGILAATIGTAALAGLMAGAQVFFIGRMASHKLAAIATGGMVLLLAPIALGVSLAVRPLALGLVRATLPRGRRMSRTGSLLLLLALAGVLAFVGALSRADWRVLDLGPFKALALVLVLGMGHGNFWYGLGPGRRLHARFPTVVAAVRGGTVLLVGGLLVSSSRVPETSPVYQAATDESWGLRLGLKVARALTDHDRDGFSARFGGGDCDDARADVFPGAEDVPGDGVDQNCEGGDATGASPRKAGAPAAAATATARAPRPGAFTGNILVISIDALRADRLGVAGYGRPPGQSLTPALDGLARRGAYFRRAWAQAPNTPRSFPSLVTSRYPSDIAWKQVSLNYSPILPTNETFFDHLGRGGLRPIGIFSHFYFTDDRGVNKGFAEWSNDGARTIAESNKDIATPRIVPRVIARLQRAAATRERFVLWTHLFEPHSSYMEHPEFPVTRRGVEGLEEKYDFEIAFVDRWIGRILGAVEASGLRDSTAVLVFADHGEAWGEHKVYFHGQDLSEEQLRVPIILAVPGLAPVVSDDDVALVDVGPTLLDLVGVDVPASFQGRSLLPRVGGGKLPPRPVYAELLPATAWPKHEVMMVDGTKKITHRITDRRYELHDLAADPRQQNDLARDSRHQSSLETMRAKLRAFEERAR